jgi:hypothetical protein
MLTRAEDTIVPQGYVRQEGWPVLIEPYIVPDRFPLTNTYDCHPLPHVIGPTVSEYYEVIRLPNRLRLLPLL